MPRAHHGNPRRDAIGWTHGASAQASRLHGALRDDPPSWHCCLRPWAEWVRTFDRRRFPAPAVPVSPGFPDSHARKPWDHRNSPPADRHSQPHPITPWIICASLHWRRGTLSAITPQYCVGSSLGCQAIPATDRSACSAWWRGAPAVGLAGSLRRRCRVGCAHPAGGPIQCSNRPDSTPDSIAERHCRTFDVSGHRVREWPSKRFRYLCGRTGQHFPRPEGRLPVRVA
jgi:hypothetical protein